MKCSEHQPTIDDCGVLELRLVADGSEQRGRHSMKMREGAVDADVRCAAETELGARVQALVLNQAQAVIHLQTAYAWPCMDRLTPIAHRSPLEGLERSALWRSLERLSFL